MSILALMRWRKKVHISCARVQLIWFDSVSLRCQLNWEVKLWQKFTNDYSLAINLNLIWWVNWELRATPSNGNKSNRLISCMWWPHNNITPSLFAFYSQKSQSYTQTQGINANGEISYMLNVDFQFTLTNQLQSNLRLTISLWKWWFAVPPFSCISNLCAVLFSGQAYL